LGIGELNESGAQRDFENGLVGRRIEDAAARRTRPPGATQPRQQSKPADITRRNLTDRAPRGVGGREHSDTVHLAELPCRSELVQNHLHIPDPKTLTHEFLVSRYLLLAAVSVAVVPTSLTAQGQFGQALAVSGREVYVGQPGNAYGAGVVYVFQAATNGAWRATKKLTMPGATNGDGFGSAIAIDGNTLLVGSTKADSGRGAVYLFTREATSGWRESGRITAPQGKADDGFGANLLVSGDRAYIANGPQRGQASVYVFKRNGNTWAAETTFTQLDTMPNTQFGAALAASGSRLMIGSARADSGTGAVYVYNRDPAGAWKMEVRIPSPGPMTGRNAQFGSSIVLRG